MEWKKLEIAEREEWERYSFLKDNFEGPTAIKNIIFEERRVLKNKFQKDIFPEKNYFTQD